MPNYFNQSISAGVLMKVTYYRKHSHHPTHDEGVEFTTAAQNNYASINNIPVASVEVGTFRSNIGVPTAGVTQLI